jgi:hypothetical protein
MILISIYLTEKEPGQCPENGSTLLTAIVNTDVYSLQDVCSLRYANFITMHHN